MKRILIALAISATALPACSGNGSTSDPLEGVNSILILQRERRSVGGDIFQYTSYQPGGRIIELSPPTADGVITPICCEHLPEFAEADISSYDLSFDATEIVFSARLSADSSYGLFIYSLESREVEQLPTDPNTHYIMPVFVPGDRIFFMTNNTIDEDGDGNLEVQFRDEYERGTTTQIGFINRDGTDMTHGPRNLSHRVFPSVLSDGRVMLTQWDHLGMMNSGHLVIANPDMTTVREAFGKEGTGVTNSYTKAIEVSPGRVVAIGSSRSRTLQSGTILDIRLGTSSVVDGQVVVDPSTMSEANASYKILTPSVPLGREPSSQTIGRYYDAYPLDNSDNLNLLVSWADGPVESGTLSAAGLTADYGVYLYDSAKTSRRPILNDDTKWDLFPRPFQSRPAPPAIEGSGSHQFGDSALLVAMNVYESTRFNFAPGEAIGVRVREGFSGEEGVGRDFGLTEHEGAAILGIAPIHSDGSYAAEIPASIPVAQQVIDRFGMSLGGEPVWVSGAPGESRACGGCHENRAETTVINPGITEAFAYGPANLMSDVPRYQRVSTDMNDYVSTGAIVGMPWSITVQAIFDNKCISCHNGDETGPNPGYTITDPETGDSFEWYFDLRGDVTPASPLGETLMGGYSASHLSIMGPDMMDLEDAGLEIVGDMKTYIEPTRARDSELIRVLNPPQLFRYDALTGSVADGYDPAVRAFEGPIHSDVAGFTPLTAAEYYQLILAADNGGQYYSRENQPGSTW